MPDFTQYSSKQSVTLQEAWNRQLNKNNPTTTKVKKKKKKKPQ